MVSKSNKREKGIKGNKRENPFWKEKGKGNNTLRVFPFLLSLYGPEYTFNEKEKGKSLTVGNAIKKREFKGKIRERKGNSLLYWLTAYPNAGYLSFLFDPAMLPGGQDHRKNAVKLARFMHGLGVKNGHKTPDNSLIMVIRDFGKNTYHNHEFNIPNFSHNIRCFQMINDLQRGFENADNFSLV